MAFMGTEPIRNTVLIDNISEQVNTFTYLGCNISYEEEKDIHSKIAKLYEYLDFRIIH
jgi:flagellin-specific chaperone FliS